MTQTILVPNIEQPHLFSVNFNPKIIIFLQEIHCNVLGSFNRRCHVSF